MGVRSKSRKVFIYEISPEELSRFHLVKYALLSHGALDESDLLFSSNYICSFFNKNRDNTHFLLFLTYANKRNIGKFAFVYNDNLDEALKSRDYEKINKLLLGDKNMFLEVYDNSHLSDEGREFIIRAISRDFYSYNLAFRVLQDKLERFECLKDGCELRTDTNTTSAAAVCERCTEASCLEASGDAWSAVLMKNDILPEKIYTIDCCSSGKEAQPYCFNSAEMLDSMSEDYPINPQTKKPFSRYSVDVLRKRFSNEIAMTKRYKEYLRRGK